jgi:serine phosphatase RsbU (regulator of sigma subunit)
MWKPPSSFDEQDRLEDLRRLDLLLTTPEEPLDHITRELAKIFGVPGAFISFIDGDTQHYKSEVGLPPEFAESRREPRDISLCSYVVGTNEPLYVQDLAADPRFSDSPGVTKFGLRFYAGAPLRGDRGYAVGSLCIVDHSPRHITPREQQLLIQVAEGVMAQVRLQIASKHLLERSLKIERDLQQAVAVQRFLLPEANLEGGGWQIRHTYHPVEHLGGDLVDVYQRLDGGFFVLIADVTGHGTTAALTAAMTKAAFLGAAATMESPGAVLNEMNRKLLGVAPPSQFVTAQVVKLTPETGVVSVASAGHTYPLQIYKTDVEVIDTTNGPPLLVLEHIEYEDVPQDIGAGESILLYTDGVIEASDASRQLLGVHGLRNVLKAVDWSSPGPLDDVMKAISNYAHGSLADDIALVSIHNDSCAGSADIS